jgi:hypothetical protein
MDDQTPSPIPTSEQATAVPALISKPPTEEEVAEASEKKEVSARFMDALNSLLDPKAKTISGSFLSTSPASVVARLINLVPRLSQSDGDESEYEQAILAAKLLLNNPGSAGTVALILDDMDYQRSRNSPIYAVMSGLVLSAIGVFIFLLATLGILSWAYSGIENQNLRVAVHNIFDSLASSPLFVSIVFGMLGSVVSILLRLSDFQSATRRSRQFLRMTGFMLPIVGAVFAAITCSIFASGIINFSFAGGTGSLPPKGPYFYMVVGFLSGFSERFTRGLLGSAENAISAGWPEKPQPVPASQNVSGRPSDAAPPPRQPSRRQRSAIRRQPAQSG